jgi:O-methyltransferase involved in polyketide biosynthesis
MTPTPVDLGPVAETLLIPLYGRAVLTRRGSPLIDDQAAVAMVDAIDWDFGRFDRAPSLLGSVLRTRWFDLWAADWLDRHPGGTVVELGAGLNTRAERLDRPGAHWLDVDLPDAMALRGRFVAETARRRQVAASATEAAWAEAAAELPGPWLVLAEAVLCFLPEDQVAAALRHAVTLGTRAGTPPGSEVAFDTWGTWMRDNQDDHDALKVMDARVRWFSDDPTDAERLALGLQLAESASLADAPPALADLLGPDDRAAYETAGQEPQARSYRLNRYTVS